MLCLGPFLATGAYFVFIDKEECDETECRNVHPAYEIGDCNWVCRFFEMVIQSVVRCFGCFADAMSTPFLLV